MDMTPRAVEVLQSVDLVAAEDTRHSKPLLQYFGVNTRLISLHEHNEMQRTETLLEQLHAGQSIALISDAGTPIISDPGYRLVSQVKAAGIKVIPVPGCSAVITALSSSGLSAERFTFIGFLPAKAGARVAQLDALKNQSATLIFYESPRRLLDTLQDCISVFGGERQACLARELTKIHETIETKTLTELAEWVAQDPNQQRGECVLIVEGLLEVVAADDAEIQRVLSALLPELPVKKAAAVTATLTGCSKNTAYQQALKIQQAE
jgi:16S rRNA (cytidine1402-2'-O)-methyltransferase